MRSRRGECRVGLGSLGRGGPLVPRRAPPGARGGKVSPRRIWLGGQTRENCHLMRGAVDSGYRPSSVSLAILGGTRSQRGISLAFWNEGLGRDWGPRNTQ